MKKVLFLFTALLCFQYIHGQTGSVHLYSSTTLVGQFATIDSAWKAIPSTLSNSYIIELQQSYNGSVETVPIILNHRNGASIINTVTIRPAAGVTNVTLSKSSSENALILLDDADFVIIDGRPAGAGSGVLVLNNSGTGSNTNTIELINGASNNIIRYCRIENGTTGLAGRGIAILGSNTSEGNSDNLVEFCVMATGRYKINISGSSTVPNSRNKIYGVEFLNPIFAGFWAQGNSSNTTVDSCIFHSTSPAGEGIYAILFDFQRDSAIITRNRIYEIDNGSNSSACIGISIRSTDDSIPSFSEISNNMIALTSPNPSSNRIFGIEYDGSNPTSARVIFNTVRITGNSTNATSSSACFIKGATNDSSKYIVSNNIFVNERLTTGSGISHTSITIEDSSGLARLDENTYNSAAGTLVSWMGQSYSDLAIYRGVIGGLRELNSNDAAVTFVSASDLHLSGSSLGDFRLSSTAQPAIDSDFDGDLRGTFPYRGADEASPLLTSIDLMPVNSFTAVYPNPAKTFVDIFTSERGNINVELLTPEGRVAYSQMVIVSENHFRIDLADKNLPSALYFLRLSTFNSTQVVRLFLCNQ